MKDPDCIFCNIPDESILLKNKYAFVINDKYPHSKGHVLVIPYNHDEDFFNLDAEDQKGMLELMNEAKKHADEKHSPAAYNVSINNGKAAGQVVMHTHIHLIPRYNSK